MIDSYALFISRSHQAQSALKKSLHQIAYSLQVCRLKVLPSNGCDMYLFVHSVDAS